MKFPKNKSLDLFFLFIFISFINNGYTQNLVANYSFEDENYCEANIPCSPAAWYSVYNMPYGYDNNNTNIYKGKHTLGFLVLLQKENIRTYWQTPLLCSLEKGKEYDLKFHLLSPDIKFDPKLFSAFFSESLFFLQKDTVLTFNNSIKIGQNSISPLKKSNWVQISIRIVAMGNEKVLVLGNFSSESNSCISQRYSGKKYVEYYIDNLSLLPVSHSKEKCVIYQFRLDSLYSAKVRHKYFQQSLSIIVSNPIIANKPFQKNDTLVLNSDIFFDFDSYSIKDTALLYRYLEKLDVQKIAFIEVNGYTDSIGSASYNQKLSLNRAIAIKNYIISSLKLNENLITSVGRGISTAKKPIEQNRRVEIIITNKYYKLE